MATSTLELVSMVESLPVDVRITLVNRILESLSPSQKEIDELWKTEVESRIQDVEDGKVQTIPGDEVFAKVRERFSK